jgi:hypothetical protein
MHFVFYEPEASGTIKRPLRRTACTFNNSIQQVSSNAVWFFVSSP